MCSPWGSPGTPPSTAQHHMEGGVIRVMVQVRHTLKLQQQGSENCRWGILDGENQA